MNLRPLVAVLSGVLGLVSVGAQVALSAQDPGQFSGCPRYSDEDDSVWQARCAREADVRGRNSATQLQISQARLALLAKLEKQPALAPSRNRLIGRWAQVKPARPANQVFGVALPGGCELLLGDGSVEFRSDRWIVTDSDGATDLGPVSYREGNNSVYVLPKQGIQLMTFTFESADRASVSDMGDGFCSLMRVTGNAPPAPAPATGRGASPAPTGRPGGAPAAPAGRVGAAPPAPASAPASASRLLMLDDLMGYQCANGEQLVVNSCSNTSDESNCGVIRMDLPLRNGFQVRTNVTRGVLVKQVSGCKVLKLTLDQDGNVVPAK
jgi:hypothetical protein